MKGHVTYCTSQLNWNFVTSWQAISQIFITLKKVNKR